MAAKILKMNRALGFDSEEFKLTIKKSSDNSVKLDYEREINGHVLYGSSTKNEVANDFAERIKKAIDAFLMSSYKEFIIIGKVSEKSE